MTAIINQASWFIYLKRNVSKMLTLQFRILNIPFLEIKPEFNKRKLFQSLFTIGMVVISY